MKRIIITFSSLIFSLCVYTQETELEQFVSDCEKEVGTWVADNSNYKNENEPYDQYAIEWKWGLGKKNLIGRLYGIKDGKDIGSFWEFRKYFNPSINKVVVLQFGSDGSFSEGQITHISKNETKLQQTVINPNGSTFKIGHKTTILNQDEHIAESFNIDSEDKWTSRRSYTWIKKRN